MKRPAIIGFIFGLIAPLLMMGVGLQIGGIVGLIAQKFVEFSYILSNVFGTAFGNLSGASQIIVFLSSGFLWAAIFHFGSRFFRKQKG